MTKTQYYTATSLDGFIATEDDSIDWLDALAQGQESTYGDFIAGVGALCMGAHTYEWMLRYFAASGGDATAQWPYSQPAFVVTHRDLPAVTGVDVRFVQGDVASIHEEMRRVANGKNLWIAGGGDLVGQFHDAGLLDEIIVQVGSATLGSGKPLLPRRITSPPLRLVSARQLGAGFAELRYEVQRGD